MKEKDYKRLTWEQLYEACTTQEREDIVILMLKTIESRQDEEIEIYKQDPELLASLSVSALRNLAGKASNDAHKKILERYPESADLLLSFECLTSFSLGKDETIHYNDLTDVISSLKEVWACVSTETKGNKP